MFANPLNWSSSLIANQSATHNENSVSTKVNVEMCVYVCVFGHYMSEIYGNTSVKIENVNICDGGCGNTSLSDFSTMWSFGPTYINPLAYTFLQIIIYTEWSLLCQ